MTSIINVAWENIKLAISVNSRDCVGGEHKELHWILATCSICSKKKKNPVYEVNSS